MATTFTWDIDPLECAVLENDLPNVVKTVHWRYTVSDGLKEDSLYGSVDLNPPTPDKFTPYDKLTKEQVIMWIVDGLNEPAMQKALLDSINNQEHPQVINNNPPWGPSANTVSAPTPVKSRARTKTK